jgi:membrane-associated HD superfamily phosphohydrolase
MHSSVVIYGEPTSSSKKVPKTTLFFVYAVFLLPLLFLSNNLWRVVYFLISLFAKFMGHKSTPESKHFVSTFIVFFITFPIIFFSGIWNFLFPLPQEVLINKPQNVQGLVVESPQTFLVWGIVYSIGVAIVELILFFHSRNYHYVDKYKIKERI